MGKRGGKRWKGGRGGHHNGERKDVPIIDKENKLFEEYYKQLGTHRPEEREEFWATLRRELPNSFRFTGSKSHALQVQRRLQEHYIPKIVEITYEGQQVTPPAPIPWFPDAMAWEMTTPKNVIRRFPPFASFQKFLVSETSVGNITRQEAVSMIPPLVLDVKPGMTVLDMCAAPGSKAGQLIEMVHGGEEARLRQVIRQYRQQQGRSVSPEGEDTQQDMETEAERGDWADDGRSTGLLIANDADSKRAHLLVHQMKRLNSPNLIVTNHDASQYPSIKLRSPLSPDGKAGKGRYLKFDRILADVPCSGDGTVRKNIAIWRDWTPGNGIGLHPLQLRILVRALQLLKVGGRVVYSTCSMNPVENEAVVAAAIERCGGMDKVSLLETSMMLPGLKRYPGLTNWTVMGKDGKLWPSWEAVGLQQQASPNADTGKLTKSLFAPVPETIPLNRCMRITANLQDTGAFFIAVLEKKTEIRVVAEEPTKAVTEKPSSVPIATIIDEIATNTNGPEASEHVAAADSIGSLPNEAQTDNATPAMRRNQELPPLDQDGSTEKRKAEAEEDGPNKRQALVQDPPSPADAQRRVHYPPPPGAHLELTAHANSNAGSSAFKETRSQSLEEPFKYLEPDHEVIQQIIRFYDIDERFPRDRFMVRNANAFPSKKIYYTSELSKEILTENEGKGIKFVYAGITMFVRQDVQSEDICRWRMQTDGITLLESWVGESRVIRLHSRAVLRKLLIEMFPKISGGGWLELGELGREARTAKMGCYVLRLEKGDGEDSFSERTVIPLWRSAHSLNLMLPKEDRKAMLLRMFNDETPLQDHSKDRFQNNSRDEDLTSPESAQVLTEEVEGDAAKMPGETGATTTGLSASQDE